MTGRSFSKMVKIIIYIYKLIASGLLFRFFRIIGLSGDAMKFNLKLVTVSMKEFRLNNYNDKLSKQQVEAEVSTIVF